MAKKELTEEDKLKKQYSELVKINQKLKNISSGYYISYDGMIYMKSLVPFVEKFIHLHNPEVINKIYGAMIMPNAFFDFTKKAKKTKLTILETESKIHFGQNDTDELVYTINIVNDDELIDKDYIDAKIKPEMYKRFFELNSDKYIQYEDNNIFHPLTEEEVKSMANASVVYLNFNNTTLTLTKQLFLDIKKTDNFSIRRVCYEDIGKGKARVFYMIKQSTELYDIYTIFNTLQS